MVWRGAWGVAAAMVLAGCSLVRPTLERPHVEVVGIAVEHASLLEQRLRVRVRVDNPNTLALPVRALTFTVDLDGARVGTGANAAPFTVAPRASSEFDALVTTDLATTLAHVLPHLHDGAAPIDYRLQGVVETELAFFRRVPFDEHGRYDVAARAR